jgi:hypothetical protein
MKFYSTQLKREKNKIILSNGSERGCYVPMEHVFNAIGQIHDGIQLMKTFYPHDETWSSKEKISLHTVKKNVDYIWDYEYEDYDPLDIFSSQSSTLFQMREIKQFGSDIFLTLTLDLALSDEEMLNIVRSLTPFGRIYLRINHECNGNWFRYNLYNSFKEISNFFVRFHKIVKSVSTNIYTIFNISADVFVAAGIVNDDGLHLGSSELKAALEISDYWAIDKYKSLHFGWPFKDEVNEETAFNDNIQKWWTLIEECYIKMIWENNLTAKPLFITEFNSDSDVDGLDGQAGAISQVYERLATGNFNWIEGIVLYQFRDYGGLGLEKGDSVHYDQLPSLDAYRQSILKFKYNLNISVQEWKRDDFNFAWFNADSITALTIELDGNQRMFVNKFDIPLYIIYGEQQNWKRLNSNETFDCSVLHSICISVPPFLNCQDKLQYSFMLRNYSKILSTCFLQ